MRIIFGFLLTVLFVPIVAGAATTPRWALLAVAAALMVPLFRARITVPHVAGALLIAWAALSLVWTPNIYDGIDALLKLLILAALFRIGAHCESLQPFFTGAAVGMAASSIAAIAQSLGWSGIGSMGIRPSGLFTNSILMGEAAALVLIGCVVYRLWWFVPGALPALALSMCRGALVALAAAAIIWTWRRSKLTAIAIAALAVAAAYAGSALSVQERLGWWNDTLPQITLFGRGIGSFYTLYPTFGGDTFLERPEHLHNDWIELAFELGALGAAVFGTFVAGLGRGPLSFVLVAFLVECCFGFGSHMAVTGCVAALCAGYLTRSCLDLRGMFDVGRLPVYQGHRRRGF